MERGGVRVTASEKRGKDEKQQLRWRLAAKAHVRRDKAQALQHEDAHKRAHSSTVLQGG